MADYRSATIRFSRHGHSVTSRSLLAGYGIMDSMSVLLAGTNAPPFTLHSTPDQTVSTDLRGRPVILAFYPADWSPVCSDQMALYNEVLPEFAKFNAELMGISVDGAWCHAAFAENRKLHFPLLSDFEPKGQLHGTMVSIATKRRSASGRCL
jgi:peroxiredoxin